MLALMARATGPCSQHQLEKEESIMCRYICINKTGKRNYTDVPIVKKLPEIGSRTDWFPFNATEYKKFEPVSIPEQRSDKRAEKYDFFLATYRPLNLIEDVTHLIAVTKH